jgi:hypothetical protein
MLYRDLVSQDIQRSLRPRIHGPRPMRQYGLLERYQKPCLLRSRPVYQRHFSGKRSDGISQLHEVYGGEVFSPHAPKAQRRAQREGLASYQFVS